MPPNARRSAAQQRENTKRGIISVEEAGELRADPTYVDSEAEDRLYSHDTLFDCSFHLNDPSVPIYRVKSSLLTEHSILPHLSSFQFQPEDVGLSARDNTMQVDEVVKVTIHCNVMRSLTQTLILGHGTKVQTRTRECQSHSRLASG